MGLYLSFYSTDVRAASDGAYDLGTSIKQFKDLWLTGKAYIDGIGESVLFDSAAQAQFRDTTTYIWSSAAGYLTFVSGTQIDLQANVGMSAKNFIFDTVTGVMIGTTTNVKLAFFGTTPVVQQSGSIKTALANLGLVVNGWYVPSVATTSATYTIGTANEYLICNSGTTFSVNLPLAIGSYREYLIKNVGSATVTLTANTADRIDGQATASINQYEAIKVMDFTYSATVSSSSGDLAPHNMSGYSAPSPYQATASTEYAGLQAYKAFENNVGANQYWLTNGAATGWLQIYIGTANTYTVSSYGIKVNTIPEASRAPKNWTLLGSNNTTGSWTTLDTVSDQTGWTSGQLRTFTCANTTAGAFSYFRVDITSNNGDASYTQIAELYLYYSIPSSGSAGAWVIV